METAILQNGGMIPNSHCLGWSARQCRQVGQGWLLAAHLGQLGSLASGLVYRAGKNIAYAPGACNSLAWEGYGSRGGQCSVVSWATAMLQVRFSQDRPIKPRFYRQPSPQGDLSGSKDAQGSRC